MKRNYVPGKYEVVVAQAAGTITYNAFQYFVLDEFYKFTMSDIVVYADGVLLTPSDYELATDVKYTDIESTRSAKTLYSQIKVTNATYDGQALTVDGKNFGTATDNEATVAKVETLAYPYDLVQDPSGFVDTEILCSYNYTTRKVTLNDNGAHVVAAIWQGSIVPELIDGWLSDAHPTTSSLTTYFLYYREGTFYWSTSPWHFSDIQICSTYTGGAATFALRECHGLMQWQTHEEAHDNVGTYVKSGGAFSNYTLASTVATERRPYIAETTVKDEDLPAKLLALMTNSYTWGWLTTTGVTNATTANTEIVSIDVSGRPFYNQFTGGNWIQTIMANNEYQKVFVMAVPVTNDAESSAARFLFVQGQSVSTSLLVTQDVTPASVDIGDIAGANNEYVYIGEIIVRATSNNWYIQEVNVITGGRYNQVASPSSPTVTYQNSLQNGNIASTSAIHSDGVKTTVLSEDGLAQVELNEDLLIETNGGDVLINDVIIQNDNEIVGLGQLEVGAEPTASIVSVNGFSSVADGDTFPSQILERKNGITKTDGRYEWILGSAGALGMYIDGETSTRVWINKGGDWQFKVITAFDAGAATILNAAQVLALGGGAFQTADSIQHNGTTGERPTATVGKFYFDTTLGIPIWYDGTNWVDATGVTV